MTAVLEISGLSVSIAKRGHALMPVRDVSLKVEAGKTVCIVGESGSGKSMTAFATTGLLPRAAKRSAASIRICSEETKDFDRRAMSRILGTKVGFIFQDPMTSLNPVLTIGEQLSEVFVSHGKGHLEDARKQALALMDRVGIPSPDLRSRQYPHQLSGGLRQRAMIAMALMCSPALLLADEPTTALDVTTQAQILSLLKELQREMKMAIVLITHDLGVVSAMADEVYVMYAGQVVEHGAITQLLDDAAHPYYAELRSCIPVPGMTARGTRLPFIRGAVPLVTSQFQGCAFRDRCDFARLECGAQSPPIAEIAPGHFLRCLVPAAERGVRDAGSQCLDGK